MRTVDAGGATLDTDTFSVTGCGVGPVLTMPDDITVDTNDAAGATVSFSVGATDVVDAKLQIPLEVVCSKTSGSLFAVGTTEVTCHVTDSHGNTASDGSM